MKFGVMVSLVLFFSFLAVSISFNVGNVNLTGNVVYEPSPIIGCLSSDINSTWNEIFNVDLTGAVYYLDSVVSGEECLSFIMFKNDSLNNSYILLREGSIEEIKTSAYFVNGNYSLINSVSSSITGYSEGLNFVENTLFDSVNIVDRDIVDSNDASSEFSNTFTFTSNSFTLNGDYYEFAETDSVNLPGEGSFPDDEIRGYIHSSESYNYFEFINYTHIREIEFEENISDFIFLVNSSWNDAFDFDDHFDFGWDAELGVRSWGSGNDGGSIIDFDLDDEITARFRPAEGYIGSKVFIVYVNNSAYDLVSNPFTIEIVEELPSAPRMYQGIADINLRVNQSIEIDLGQAFTDDDGDALTYNFSGGEDLIISISGSILTVSINDSFGAFDSFSVGATDGTYYTESSEIEVFLDTREIREQTNTTPINYEVVVENINSTDNDEEESSFNFNWMWVAVGSGVFIIFIIIGIVIYYFATRPPKAALVEKPQAVNSYLDNLKRNGTGGSFGGIQTSNDKAKLSNNTLPVPPSPVQTVKKQVVQTADSLLNSVKNMHKKVVEKVKYVNKPVQNESGWKFMGNDPNKKNVKLKK